MTWQSESSKVIPSWIKNTQLAKYNVVEVENLKFLMATDSTDIVKSQLKVP